MYHQIIDSFAGFQLVFGAVILYYVGVAARKSSALARERGITFGIFAAAILIGEGWLASGMELLDFLSLELFRLLLVTVATVGVVSVVMKFADGLFRRTVLGPYRRLQFRLRQSAAKREQQKREATQKRLAEIRSAEWEAGRPERERLEREKAERDRVEADRKRIDNERRENARHKLLLCYHQNSPQVQESISWERFNAYAARYLADQVPADQVEENAERMIGTIESLFEPPEQPVEYRSVEEIRGEYESEREEVIRAGYDEQRTAAMLADIAFREDQALTEERR